ncbi:response regulator transcription factor [Echinicola vietnamensis]|uniref:Response regulator containing a CheY-like receiver domain and an HTH DNA-binding domain n=1 Tax=Echinicola vietnamensis (strain DSM 17526 / LMG 23754 / KMM 6221) TaxID=926556 RepID=L0G6T6_ECHVK|nr:response regulator transcription factor [Echinicola vietnamensis]AGA80721.1 response regulator containing a CheY-like receiver domain and an HTH DNA-binding domain [Echinicola vietnamensis DSM 17526]
MEQKIRIALADDERLFRAALGHLLEHTGSYEVVFDVGNGVELTEKLVEAEGGADFPDIILMDLKMPEMNGVETTKVVAKKYPEVKVIALTTHKGKAFILNMLNLGASGYITKDASPEAMLEVVGEVAEKGFFYSNEILQIINGDFHNRTKKNSTSEFDAGFITKREREILLLLCQQYRTQEIAEKLFLSERTVEGHRNNLLSKTNSKNVVGLIVFGLQHEIIDVSDLTDPLND